MALLSTRRQGLKAAAGTLLAGLFRPTGAKSAIPASVNSGRTHSNLRPDKAAVEKALQAFSKIVGKAWVFDEPTDVALYRDPYSLLWGEPEEKIAGGAVSPTTVEEVVEIIKVANEYRIPIYPVSTGKNLGYGGAAPVLPGSVVLDLKRMNRIIEVNEANSYALVEPGVSYFDLYNHIQEKGARLWLDVPGPGWGSLIGNALDRGLGNTVAQYRNHFDAHCGMEVVLPTGNVMRTGMGALPNSETWQQFKSGFGPWVDGLFSQSNFGVVTKMGFWLLPEPEAFATGRIRVAGYHDLIDLVRIVNRLEASHVIQGFITLSCPVTGSSLGGGPADKQTVQVDPEILAAVNGPSGFDPTKVEQLARDKGVPFWGCDINFYGPPKLIKAQWSCVVDALAEIDNVQCELGDIQALPLEPKQLDALSDTIYYGIPTLRSFSIGPLSEFDGAPVVGHVLFSPVIPRTGEGIIKANQVLGAIVRRYGLPLPPVQFPHTGIERSFLFVTALPVTRDPKVNAKIRSLFQELITAAAAQGWGEYRTTSAFYDQIMEIFLFSAFVTR